MRSRNLSILLIILASLLIKTTAVAQETVLFNFKSMHGSYPVGGVILDASGNLYGVTYYGGAYNYGTVYELSPVTGGGWEETVLYSFNDNGKGGYYPAGPLTFDSAGNLYGTSYAGGSYNLGTVFELIPGSGGSWTEKILHSFADNLHDGFQPETGVVFDASGNLYGTTPFGGVGGSYGTVFELAPVAGGGWNEAVLHTFKVDGSYSASPNGGLVLDASGNIYGTTYFAGQEGYGNVFELSPTTGAQWTEKVLYSFGAANDGENPASGVIFDSAGNLYGTTIQGGGSGDYGTAFELTPTSRGGWKESVLHTFSGKGAEGTYPSNGLALDTSGNLYGTTGSGGTYSYGTVFKLTPPTGGAGGWTASVLNNFNYTDGAGASRLIFGTSGNLYGTTASGGIYGYGLVFEITP